MSTIDIAGRSIGPGQPVYVVGEISANHLGSLERAKELCYTVKFTGGDAVKTQCFTPDAMTLDSDAAPFRVNWQGQATTLYRLYQQAAMPLDWHAELKELCDSLGLAYFASVFDQTGIDLMVSLGVPALKIASFELTDLPLIRAAARTGLPLILSTGMATPAEIRDAIIAAQPFELEWRNPHTIMLKCTSDYPAPVSAANLRVREVRGVFRFGTVWGLSDHTRSNSVVSAAVALGACLVERHLTLSRADGGPDAAFSDEPAEFAAMVRAVRETEAALGTVHYGPTDSEVDSLRFRRSCWVVRDILAGEKLTAENVRVLRPADGLPPSEYDAVLDRRAKVAIPKGTPLAWRLLE